MAQGHCSPLGTGLAGGQCWEYLQTLQFQSWPSPGPSGYECHWSCSHLLEIGACRVKAFPTYMGSTEYYLGCGRKGKTSLFYFCSWRYIFKEQITNCNCQGSSLWTGHYYTDVHWRYEWRIAGYTVLPARARRPPITLRKTSIWGPQRAKKERMKQITRMIKPQKSMAAAALPHATREKKQQLVRQTCQI